MPPALIEPLRGLHDRVPPRPFAALRGHVERELGRPLADVFEHVDEQPIAAASLAQVHRARLKSGEDVVIKVQYPEARRLFPIDMGSLRRAVRAVRWLARIDLRPLANELAAQVCLELEFDREARSAARVRAAFDGRGGVHIPRVYDELSTDKLLVLEFVDGRPLTDIPALEQTGVDLRTVASSIADLYATMIFEHGFFHGDPHPGNILVAPDRTTIILLDFGLAKELPPGFADGAATMIVKGMSGDLAGAIAAARSIGFETDGDPEAFRDLLRAFMGDNDRVRNALDALRSASLKGIPSDFAIIGRAFILLNGLSHRLAPGERLIASAVTRHLASRVLGRAQAAAAQAQAQAS
ncbi:MAG: AarF/ABC1/UbiB kinase family protein [Deltaproteobacteria bacterium]|nr:AarF/ABC1/UbiB kinase family protein [Kofleriaceae bacterium]